tara:strand:+ start:1031 stop:1576 length:546 start_codon:yes stop_codon:yes gene_type:complete
MTEQVVDIRDRIEKMRNQMSDGGASSSESLISSEKKKVKVLETENNNNKQNTNEVKNMSSLKNSLQKNDDFVDTKFRRSDENSKHSEQINKNQSVQQVKENIKTESNEQQSSPVQKKVYENYEKNNTSKTNKSSIDIGNQNQAFPQFSLNVSNPISWKLMLLIMLMQLLTNIMLVVVLYLK